METKTTRFNSACAESSWYGTRIGNYGALRSLEEIAFSDKATSGCTSSRRFYEGSNFWSEQVFLISIWRDLFSAVGSKSLLRRNEHLGSRAMLRAQRRSIRLYNFCLFSGNLWVTTLHHQGHRDVTVSEMNQSRLDIVKKLGKSLSFHLINVINVKSCIFGCLNVSMFGFLLLNYANTAVSI